MAYFTNLTVMNCKCYNLIYSRSGSSVMINNSLISGNSAEHTKYGLIYVTHPASLRVYNSVFTENYHVKLSSVQLLLNSGNSFFENTTFANFTNQGRFRPRSTSSIRPIYTRHNLQTALLRTSGE